MSQRQLFLAHVGEVLFVELVEIVRWSGFSVMDLAGGPSMKVTSTFSWPSGLGIGIAFAANKFDVRRSHARGPEEVDMRRSFFTPYHANSPN